jgi:myo-inositol-1-phosphate synthase
MNSDLLTANYEQKIPMWDEAEKKQTVKTLTHKIETVSKVPKLGVMLVGLGGNNGSTFVASMIANKKK